MELFAFGLASLVAIVATILVIINPNPVHALLNLIVSLLAVAMIFFILGAPFAGILEIVIYAGAIMVLFVFVVMMLNLGDSESQERRWMRPASWILPGLLSLMLFSELCYALVHGGLHPAGRITVDAKQIGIALYGPYLLAVELASMLLLAALVAAYHLGRQDEKN